MFTDPGNAYMGSVPICICICSSGLKIDPLIVTEAQHLRPSSRSDPMLVTRSLKLYNMVGSAEVSNRGDNETCMIKSSFKDILHIVPNTKKTDSKRTGCGKRRNV